MKIEDLPRYFKREENCLWGCGKTLKIYEFFLREDESEVVTRFRCKECGRTYGLVYSGGHVDSFKKAKAKADGKQQGHREEPRTAEDIYV